MTNDTMKSLGFLKKSLKMSRRAVEKNAKDDGTTGALLTDIQGKMDALNVVIETWEKAASVSNAVPVVSAAIPSGMVQPTPAAAVISTVPDPKDSDPSDPSDDLLTVS